MRQRPRILYLVTEDWYFCSHRLPVARAARDAGAEVVVATRVTDHGAAIEAEGFRLVPLGWTRGGTSLWRELKAFVQIVRLYARERPDLAHHVAMKPILYGGIAARLTGVAAVVNAATGLGYLFISARGLKARLAQALLRLALSRRGGTVLVQNLDDVDTLRGAGMLGRARVEVIRGSGVDLRAFAPAPEPAGTPRAVLVGRMLWDKGVGELAEAGAILRRRGVDIEVALAGPEDLENPRGIPAEQLHAWQASGALRWLGPVGDVAALWRDAHIAVLPSYREGLPKALLEAAASGRPMVATDVPGCREVVRPGETGLLVPPRDPAALADALQRLAEDPTLRARLGAAARARAVEAFGAEAVAAETLALYRGLLPAEALA